MRSRSHLAAAVLAGAMAFALPFHADEPPADQGEKEKNPMAELLCMLGDPNCAPQEEPAPSS